MISDSALARCFKLGALAAFLSVAALATEQSADPKSSYPLTTCVVSDEKLGEMGDAVDYLHHEAGKPDRLVRFCCKHCIDDFKKDPAKYLQKIDEAEATAKAQPAPKK